MAHRALVAYERPDDRYDVHRSRVGGLDCRLSRAITAVDPYAGRVVDPVPSVVARRFSAVRTMVDVARHDAFYRVRSDYTVQTYLPLWLGFDHYVGRVDPDDRPDGLLVAVTGPADAVALREWFRTTKDALADAVVAGHLDPVAARSVLEGTVERRVTGREVLDVGPPPATNE